MMLSREEEGGRYLKRKQDEKTWCFVPFFCLLLSSRHILMSVLNCALAMSRGTGVHHHQDSVIVVLESLIVVGTEMPAGRAGDGYKGDDRRIA